MIKDNSAHIALTSVTPNFKEYQMKEFSEGKWIKCDSSITLPLKGDKLELTFHTVNLADVSGPEYKVVLTSN